MTIRCYWVATVCFLSAAFVVVLDIWATNLRSSFRAALIWLMWGALFVIMAMCSNASSNDWFYVTVVNSGNTNAGNIRIFGDAPDRHCVTGCGQNPGGVCGSSTLGGLNMGTSVYLFGGFSSQYPQTIYFGYNAGSCQFVGEPGICLTNKGPSQFTLSGPPNQGMIGTLYIDAWNGSCGTASNCIYHGQIVNNSSYAQTYGLYHNGSFSGQVMAVNPSSTLAFDMNDPNCCPACWYVQLLSDTTLNFTNPIITTNGGFIGTGVTTPVHPGNELPLNNTNLNLTASPNAGGGGTNLDFGPQYGNVSTNNSFINSNLVAGFNKVVDSVNSEANLLHGDLTNHSGSSGTSTNIVSVSLTNNISITNNVTVTNVPDTNALALLGQIATNTSPSNWYGFATNFGGTQWGAAVSNFIATGVSNGTTLSNGWIGAAGGVFTNFPSLSPGPDGVVFTFGSLPGGIAAPDMEISLAHLTATLPVAATWITRANIILGWLIWVGCFIAMVTWGETALSETMNQRQVQGFKAQFVGTNGEILVAPIYVALMAAAIVAIPGTLLTMWAPVKTTIAGLPFFSTLQASAGFEMWQVMLALTPLDAVIAAFMTYWLFRVVGMGLMYAVRMLIFCLAE